MKSWAQLLGPARTLAFILKAAVAECPLELKLIWESDKSFSPLVVSI